MDFMWMHQLHPHGISGTPWKVKEICSTVHHLPEKTHLEKKSVPWQWVFSEGRDYGRWGGSFFTSWCFFRKKLKKDREETRLSAGLLLPTVPDQVDRNRMAVTRVIQSLFQTRGHTTDYKKPLMNGRMSLCLDCNSSGFFLEGLGNKKRDYEILSPRPTKNPLYIPLLTSLLI